MTDTEKPESERPADGRRGAAGTAGPDSAAGGYSGEAARQGYIVLRTRARRRVFIAGLAGILVLLLLLAILV